jgi:hypothetical protein
MNIEKTKEMLKEKYSNYKGMKIADSILALIEDHERLKLQIAVESGVITGKDAARSDLKQISQSDILAEKKSRIDRLRKRILKVSLCITTLEEEQNLIVDELRCMEDEEKTNNSEKQNKKLSKKPVVKK